jgi:hypothetical protein
MEFKVRLRTGFDNINSIQDQINSLIIPTDFTNDINNISYQITSVADRMVTMDDVNSAAHIRM